MPKRKQQFWVIGEDQPEETETPEEEESGRQARGEHREQREDLKDLANRLARLSPKMRRTMPLDEETLAQLDLLAAAENRPDRRRVLMRASTLLANADQEKVEAALSGNTPANQWDRDIAHWRSRILAGDDRVIQSFLEAYPQSDRQAIRTAAREARAGASAAAARLLQLLRDGASALVEEDEQPE